jgi:carboxypeptidase PM20D1
MPFGKRLALANLWLLEPIVRRMMAKQPVTNAVLRTTTAPTVIEGGVKENVLPSRARALVNFRIVPGDTMEGVLAHVRAVVADPRVHVRRSGRLDADPPPLSPLGSRAYQLIETAVRRHYPAAVIVPGLVLGVTDARHYTALAGGVYHFAPFVLRGQADRESLHGTNERIRVDDLETGVSLYRELLRDGT